jgi:hypothetical protein
MATGAVAVPVTGPLALPLPATGAGTVSSTESGLMVALGRAEAVIAPTSAEPAVVPTTWAAPMVEPATGTMTVSPPVAVSGAGSAGWLGRWVGGRLHRGHRPIIARTRGPSGHRAGIAASVEAPLHTRELGAPG